VTPPLSLIVRICDCCQAKSAADGSDNTPALPGSSSKPVEQLLPTSRPSVLPPAHRALVQQQQQQREPVHQRSLEAEELCHRPNPSDLVLGFRQHRMNQQRQVTTTNATTATALSLIPGQGGEKGHHPNLLQEASRALRIC